MGKAINKFIPSESQEQITLFSWADLQSGKYPELSLLHHIPNGGSRDAITGAKLKAEGVKSGVPDICLPIANGDYHGLYIELKRKEGGSVSANQKRWLADLSKQGYLAKVCYGFEDAQETILEYIKRGRKMKTVKTVIAIIIIGILLFLTPKSIIGWNELIHDIRDVNAEPQTQTSVMLTTEIERRTRNELP